MIGRRPPRRAGLRGPSGAPGPEAARHGGRLPGRGGSRDDRGLVTAETAVLLPVLALLLAAALWAVTAVAGQARCLEAARDGARAVARGEQPSAVGAAVRRAVGPAATVRVQASGPLVSVQVTTRVRPLGLLAHLLPPLTLRASAVTASEPASAPASEPSAAAEEPPP